MPNQSVEVTANRKQRAHRKGEKGMIAPLKGDDRKFENNIFDLCLLFCGSNDDFEWFIKVVPSFLSYSEHFWIEFDLFYKRSQKHTNSIKIKYFVSRVCLSSGSIA